MHVAAALLLVLLEVSAGTPVTLGDTVRQVAASAPPLLFTPEPPPFVTAIPIAPLESPWPSPLALSPQPSLSVSQSATPSTSKSTIPSLSQSPSQSATPSSSQSASPSVSHSPSPSISLSATPSLSQSTRPSASQSPTPSASMKVPEVTETPQPEVSELEASGVPEPTPDPLDLSYSQPPASFVPIVGFPGLMETPSPPLSGNITGVPACLSGDTRLRLQDERVIGIDELRVGDVVEAGKDVYSRVLMFTHRDRYVRTRMVVLSVEDGEVALSPGHYVVTSDGLIPASELRVGDALVDGETVRGVRWATKIGLYNPQTVVGSIRPVNAPTVSSYTTAVSVAAGHAALAPLRALARSTGVTLGWVSTVCTGEGVVCGGLLDRARVLGKMRERVAKGSTLQT